MACDNEFDTSGALPHSQRRIALAVSLLILLLASALPNNAAAAGNYCSDTASTLNRASCFDLQDNYWVEVAVCSNETDSADRTRCLADAATERSCSVITTAS